MSINKILQKGIIIGFWTISIITIFIMLIHSGCNINYETIITTMSKFEFNIGSISLISLFYIDIMILINLMNNIKL